MRLSIRAANCSRITKLGPVIIGPNTWTSTSAYPRLSDCSRSFYNDRLSYSTVPRDQTITYYRQKYSRKESALSSTCEPLRRFSASVDTMSIHGESKVSVNRLSKPLPIGTIDSHMHIVPADFNKFPIVASAQYKPKPHTLDDAATFYAKTSGLGIATPRMVLTQISVYGTDNSALLSGLEQLGQNGRGVVECDPKQVSESQLRTWWDQGVRGIRINFVSVGRTVAENELQEILQAYVDMLSSMQMDNGQKWVVEMYIPLLSVPSFLKVLPAIENANIVRWCLDHFAGLSFKGPPAANFGSDDDPSLLPGFLELVTLLTDMTLPEVYVKISAAYRIDAAYPSADSLRRLGSVGEQLITKAEDRVLWASDWPHTRFEGIDSVPFVEACYRWCGEGEQGDIRREKLFKKNAEVLWSWNSR